MSNDPFLDLAHAIRTGDTTRADELFAQHTDLAAKLDSPIPTGAFGAKAISLAVERSDLAMIDLLVRHGADINGRSDWWAGSFGLLDLCPLDFAPALIERGAKVDAHAAARLGMLDVLQQLIDANPNLVHARGGDGQTPLHFAATVDIARFLLDRGARIDALDVDHESTPTQWMLAERPDVARYLVTRGCRTDILMAAALGAEELVRRHLDADPASIRMRVSREYFPMRHPHSGGTIYQWTIGGNAYAHVAAKRFDHEDVFQMLIGRSPADLKLAVAIQLGDEELFRAQVAENPQLIHSLGAAERPRLVEAARLRVAKAVRLMLEAGWPVDARGELNGTALHHAAWLGDADIVRDLLAHGAPVEIRGDAYDLTPLGWALHGSVNSWRAGEGDYLSVVRLLLDAGAVAPLSVGAGQASDAVREMLSRSKNKA